MLLGLAMIVKNEARGIRETLESVLPFIDIWTIIDTGSTDNTQQIIRETCAAKPGNLWSRPFVDFATTRNEALARAEQLDSRFILMLSGDETLHGGAALREFCEKSAEGAGAYHINVHFGETTYASPRLSRSRAKWRYEGVTHEILVGPNGEIANRPLPGVTIVHDLTHVTAESQRLKWERDLVLLGKETALHPEHARTAFYYAQTLHNLGHMKAAEQAYRRRIALGGWREEVYESKFRIGQILQRCGMPWPDVQAAFLEAFSYAPHRAEPLCEIAQHWYDQRDYHLCYLFASRACALSPAKDLLFVRERDYALRRFDLAAISAYYVGERAAGREYAKKALEAAPGDARLLRNLEFFT